MQRVTFTVTATITTGTLLQQDMENLALIMVLALLPQVTFALQVGITSGPSANYHSNSYGSYWSSSGSTSSAVFSLLRISRASGTEWVSISLARSSFAPGKLLT